MKYVKLFEDFAENPPPNVNTQEIDKPCVDCDMITKRIKNEIKRIDKISARKKKSEN